LLRSLARRIRKLPVLIVMTLRGTDMESEPALQAVLVDLNRERLSLQLNLERLSHDETSDLLAAVLDEEIVPCILEDIFRQTE
jgi:hypothetical protein